MCVHIKCRNEKLEKGVAKEKGYAIIFTGGSIDDTRTKKRGTNKVE